VVCDAVADDQRLVPGAGAARRRVVLELGSAIGVGAVGSHPGQPGLAWPAAIAGGTTLAPGAVANWTFDIPIPDTASPTRPYFLRQPRNGDLYVWPSGPPELLGTRSRSRC